MKPAFILTALSSISNAVVIDPSTDADYITVDFPDDPRGINKIDTLGRWKMNQNADDPFYDWYGLSPNIPHKTYEFILRNRQKSAIS